MADHVKAERLDNKEPEVVETGSSTTACGDDVRRPMRKLSLGDLHIRSREDPTAACREIREILRQIRDSLTSDAGAENSHPLSNHATSSPGPTNNCIQQDVGHLQAPQTEVVRRQNRDTQRSGWRHCRLSLPARLRPGQVDGLVQDGMNGAGSSRLGRRRVPANVRFADEVGLNLNTFAMIPPRQVCHILTFYLSPILTH